MTPDVKSHPAGEPFDASRVARDRAPLGVDRRAIAAAVQALLHAIGENPARSGLVDTPDRVARAWEEFTAGMREDPARHLDRTFVLEGSPEDIIVQRNISFYSLCEHHLVPFYGTAHVAYIPNLSTPRFVGLSKLARVVRGYAARLQVQEQLTSQVARAIFDKLQAQGAAVILEAEHLCLGMRGIKAPGTVTRTSAMLGCFASETAARTEVLALLLGDTR